MGAEVPGTQGTVRASAIGEFIRYQSCERRFKLEHNNREIPRKLPFYNRLFNPLDVVLQRAGQNREDVWAQTLLDAGVVDMVDGRPNADDDENPSWEDFRASTAALGEGEQGFAREVRLAGSISEFDVVGRADFLLLVWKDGSPRIRVVECKASRRDRTYHRLQVSIYRTLIQTLLSESPLHVAGHMVVADHVDAVVARIDETTDTNQDILALHPLNLDMEEADIARMLGQGGSIERILATDVDDIGYRIDPKCDACVFNVHCLSESARQRRIELTGANVSSVSVLREAGVRTIDELAELDPTSLTAQAVRSHSALSDDLDQLITTARTRITTLPVTGEDEPPSAFPVTNLPDGRQSQLPLHEIDGERVVRVYLGVDYDYTENRVGALTAHLTASDGQLITGAGEDADGTWVRNPVPHEVLDDSSIRPVVGRDISQVKLSQWTGDYQQDTGAERELVQNFLANLINAIADISSDPAQGGVADGTARIHFYVWSRSEMTQLVEACTRASSNLLHSLLELLGCREGVEQLIYSCLQDEVDNRFAFGWTGRGLGVLTTLTWFGQRYHWTRKVNGQVVQLDHLFTQDIFDFKTTLGLAPNGDWAVDGDATAAKHTFEIRSRFHDTLPAPYWHAQWQTLPDPDAESTPREAKSVIKRYAKTQAPNMLAEYLKARAHALRWVDERIRFKNDEIGKPRLDVHTLSRFSLGVNSTREAAVDFLRLDHAVKMTDWVSEHQKSIRGRLLRGRTLPLRDVQSDGRGGATAYIHLDGYGLSITEFQAMNSLDENAFVRVTPHSGRPEHGHTYKQLMRVGFTARIVNIDWTTGRVDLSILQSNATRYVLNSFPPESGFAFAAANESPSDFVAGRVDRRLTDTARSDAYGWFDPHHPVIPALPDVVGTLRDQAVLALSEAAGGTDRALLTNDQALASVAGLSATVQLMQGPPGTGKTQTTALAVLLRAAAQLHPGAIVVVGAHTHVAVDTLLRRIADLEGGARTELARAGLTLPPIRIAKVHSSAPTEPTGAWATDIAAASSFRMLETLRRGGVAIVGGTTSALLKMFDSLDGKVLWSRQGGFRTELLVIDEASMMVFPHFLALATAVGPAGRVLLAGDHRQLSPIVANDWENEDRPPAVAYQPFVSAYAAVREIADVVAPGAVACSALATTFRLPATIVDLISRLYQLDDIELLGVAERAHAAAGVRRETDRGLESLWESGSGLYLVVHDEHASRQSNPFEAELIRRIVEMDPAETEDRTAIITPHRAQRAVLSRLLESERTVGVIDTVERMQGGERANVIVSATVSEPSSIALTDSFVMDLNRSNVAFSRCKERLIVVCARTFLDHVPAEFETYQASMLWKSLRSLCTEQAGSELIDGHLVTIYTAPLDPMSSADLTTQPDSGELALTVRQDDADNA